MIYTVKFAALLILVTGITGALDQQEVVRELSSDKLEAIMNRLNLQYSKVNSVNQETVYEVRSTAEKSERMSLFLIRGKELKLEMKAPANEWKIANEWNAKHKFSKAVLGDNGAVLIGNLDISGGVTEESIGNFVVNFQKETAGWVRVAVAQNSNEETYKKLEVAQIEAVLKELKIDFVKREGKNSAVVGFDFKLSRNDLPLRLTTYGGEDLMIDCTYATVPMTKVNEWNIKRPYVRAVHYPGTNNQPYTALEANLDCSAGVPLSAVRYFVLSFDGEAVEFDKFLQGAK